MNNFISDNYKVLMQYLSMGCEIEFCTKGNDVVRLGTAWLETEYLLRADHASICDLIGKDKFDLINSLPHLSALFNIQNVGDNAWILLQDSRFIVRLNSEEVFKLLVAMVIPPPPENSVVPIDKIKMMISSNTENTEKFYAVSEHETVCYSLTNSLVITLNHKFNTLTYVGYTDDEFYKLLWKL